jgi:predicted ATP-dependent serine protease
MDYQCLGCGHRFNGWQNYCPKCKFGVIATINIKLAMEEQKKIRESRYARHGLRKMSKKNEN